ncbi:hypothetical protein DFJ73DRAFT_878761 [Zopfochytrium polystomum]|nr:hypothetical protein DFJ73DRAFT_878761 [Zopfochytrium polystomum]
MLLVGFGKGGPCRRGSVGRGRVGASGSSTNRSTKIRVEGRGESRLRDDSGQPREERSEGGVEGAVDGLVVVGEGIRDDQLGYVAIDETGFGVQKDAVARDEVLCAVVGPNDWAARLTKHARISPVPDRLAWILQVRLRVQSCDDRLAILDADAVCVCVSRGKSG